MYLKEDALCPYICLDISGAYFLLQVCNWNQNLTHINKLLSLANSHLLPVINGKLM